MTRQQPFVIGDAQVRPGTREVVRLPIAAMPMAAAPVNLEVLVLHGRRPGPVAWVNAAVHGDEVNGVAIVRELASELKAKNIAGTLLMIPVVNVFGFIARNRYMPDGRDLNRSFPGSRRGALASRLAGLFMDEVVSRADLGVDLHTATRHRANLPQTRGDLRNPATAELAEAFNAPVSLHAQVRPGSLRGAAAKLGVPVLVYESGQAHRFNDQGIAAGVDGVLRILASHGILAEAPEPSDPCVRLSSSKWIRASRSGILAARKALGDPVQPGEVLALISDPFGDRPTRVRAPNKLGEGIVIGRTESPLAMRGDALFNVGYPGDGPAENPDS